MFFNVQDPHLSVKSHCFEVLSPLAGDEDGWQYGIAWNTSTWVSVPGPFDMFRRRRRNRLVPSGSCGGRKAEGWSVMFIVVTVIGDLLCNG